MTWGDGGGLNTTAGASSERTSFIGGDGWITASTPWLGSVGDFGSPGQAYAPPASTPTPTTELITTPTPTDIITATVAPAATPTATVPPTSTPTSTPVPPLDHRQKSLSVNFLLIPDAVADGDGEWS